MRGWSGHFDILVWGVLFELHEGIAVGSEMANHVFLEEEVVGGGEVVVLVVLDGLEQTLPVELVLLLQNPQHLLVQQVGSLTHYEFSSVFADDA